MAKLAPFRGLRYNPGRIEDLAEVTALPYDVITPSLQDELYARHPLNMVRLAFGKVNEGDSETDNRYTRAAATFKQWQADGTLIQDDEPSIYLYDQKFVDADGTTLVRSGVMALARIEDFSTGLVKPHEKTLPHSRTDRLKLLKACSAHFSPIFSLYSDPCCVLEISSRREKERSPDIETVDDEGGVHRLWRVTDEGLIQRAHGLLDGKSLFIADGHHRYEAAISYRNYMREKHPEYTGKELFNYVLMCFANMDDPGMRIYPAHRLVSNLENLSIPLFLQAAADYMDSESESFDLHDVGERERIQESLGAKGKEGQHVLALCTGDNTNHYLALKDEEVMDRFFDSTTPKVFRTLDVSILHHLIIAELLGVSPEKEELENCLSYVKNTDEFFNRIADGSAQLAFLMNPTRMSEVRDVANAGVKMPPKSTFFNPKLLSGLVINRIDEDETVQD